MPTFHGPAEKHLVIESLEERDAIARRHPSTKRTGLTFSPYIDPGEDPNYGPGQITAQELRTASRLSRRTRSGSGLSAPPATCTGPGP